MSALSILSGSYGGGLKTAEECDMIGATAGGVGVAERPLGWTTVLAACCRVGLGYRF
jgi:hypothetical protein